MEKHATATCLVSGPTGDICAPSANVDVKPVTCAPQDLPGPETIVRDTLEWQRCPITQTFAAPGAEAYCQILELNGHDDWRWPTKAELKSLVYCSNGKQIPLLDWEDVIPRPVTWDQASCCMSFDGNGNCVAQDWIEPTISDEFEGEGDDYYSYFTSEIFPENDTNGGDQRWVVEFWNGGVSLPDWIVNLDEPDTGYNVRCVRVIE